MNCTEYEVRDYFLGELSESDRSQTARHLAVCSACASELESLRHLRFALDSLPDGEPPQRIGFVSDKVFEPSSGRRFWNAFWNSAPRLGFASAAMLSAALFAFALRPAPVPIAKRVPVLNPAVNAAAAPAFDPAPLIDRAVREAVAETEARQQKRTDLLLAGFQRKQEADRQALMLRVADAYTMLQKRMMVSRASLINYGGLNQGGDTQ